MLSRRFGVPVGLVAVAAVLSTSWLIAQDDEYEDAEGPSRPSVATKLTEFRRALFGSSDRQPRQSRQTQGAHGRASKSGAKTKSHAPVRRGASAQDLGSEGHSVMPRRLYSSRQQANLPASQDNVAPSTTVGKLPARAPANRHPLAAPPEATEDDESPDELNENSADETDDVVVVDDGGDEPAAPAKSPAKRQLPPERSTSIDGESAVDVDRPRADTLDREAASQEHADGANAAPALSRELSELRNAIEDRGHQADDEPSADDEPADDQDPSANEESELEPVEISPRTVIRPQPQPRVARREPARVAARTRASSQSPPVSRSAVAPAASAPAAAGPKRGRGNVTANPHAPSDVPLMTQELPQLRVDTIGPRTAIVDKPAEYHVVVENGGAVEARDVQVIVTIPATAEIRSAAADHGSATVDGSGRVQWLLGELSPRAVHKLTLHVIAHEKAPLDIEVACQCAPVSGRVQVDVRQPQLELAIGGAAQVECGEKQRYRLTASNPGSGPAENVTVTLQPIVVGDQPMSHKLGTIEAGEEKTVDVELVARQPGTLEIVVQAEAEQGVTARAVKEVVAAQARLAVEIKAPKVQFSGAAFAQDIKVLNAGNAPARRVKVVARLPKGADMAFASKDHKKGNGTVEWEVGEIGPGEHAVLQVKCTMPRAGEARIDVVATAGDLKADGAAVTTIMAVADLALELTDPQGPVAVGQEAVYSIRIRNRGTQAAEKVALSAYFSDGVEPVAVEGGDARLDGGAAVFKVIASLAAGEEKSLTVKVRGERAGNHRCRVELKSSAADVQLSQEETTLFFDEESGVGKETAKAAPATKK